MVSLENPDPIANKKDLGQTIQTSLGQFQEVPKGQDATAGTVVG
jgi:hypothetical protein